METKIKWFDSNKILPKEYKNVLVAFDADDIDVRYNISPRPGYVYGWYPGGSSTKDTFWAYLPATPFECPFECSF